MHILGILAILALSFEALVGFVGTGKLWKRTYGNHWRNHTQGLERSRSFKQHIQHAKTVMAENKPEAMFKTLWKNPDMIPHIAAGMQPKSLSERIMKKCAPIIYAIAKVWR